MDDDPSKNIVGHDSDDDWSTTDDSGSETSKDPTWDWLCSFCEAIFIDEAVRRHACAFGLEKQDLEYTVIDHFRPTTYRQWIKSAASGCHMCTLLLHIPEQDGDNWKEHRKNLKQKTLLYPKLSTGGVFGEAAFSLSDRTSEKCIYDPDGQMVACVHLVRANKREISNLWHRRRTAIGAISDSSIIQINKWLLQCLTNHPLCQATAQILGSGSKPKRLIHVGEHNKALRLQQTQHLPEDINYVTLTHCWGNASNARVWRDVKVDDEGWIDANSAPNLLKEAAEVVRSLPGSLYLWIDAICIDQDSAEDWEQESAKMGDIYAHAVLNLSATAARHGMNHLLGKMPSTAPCGVRIDCVEGGMHFLLAYVSNYSIWQIEEGLTNTRGWILQERMLSPRTVHFAKDQMLWECFSLYASDILPETGHRPRGLKQLATETWRMQQTHDTSTVGSKCYRPWHKIVKFYSGRNLSRASDKFAAIAGMASRIARQLCVPESDFLAGLWRGNIESDLLWHTLPKPGPSHIARAPSWSWVRTDRDVSFLAMAGTDQCYMKLLHASADGSTSPFIGTTHGVLRLKAPLCRISFTDEKYPICMREESVVDTNSEDLQIRRFDVGWDEYNLKKYNPDLKQTSAFLLIIKSCHRDPQRQIYSTKDGDGWEGAYEERFGVISWAYVAKQNNSHCVGLIVQPTGVKAGEFERLGLLVLAPSSIESLLERGKDITRLPEEYYISHDSEDGFVIDLV